MNIIESVEAGILQGLTELLPVSSSGHLILLSLISGFALDLSTIAVIHMGTLGSLLVTSKNNLKKYLSIPFIIKIAITITPAGLLGLFLENIIESKFTTAIIIASSLIFWGLIMIVVDKSKEKLNYTSNDLTEISTKQSILIGLGQCLALIPGTSRSGITTLTGIISGVNPKTSLDFSFLSGIPLIAASGTYSLYKVIKDGNITLDNLDTLLISVIFSFAFGLIAAKIFKKYVSKRLFTYSGIYRIILGVIIILIT